MKREIRYLGADSEVRAVEDNGKNFIEGYASVFNSPIDSRMPFKEVVKPGAFTRALQEGQDTLCLFNHNQEALPLGRTSSGTLQLTQDDRGLKYRVELPDTQDARDLLTSVKRGDVRHSSFGFIAKKVKWQKDDSGKSTRELHDVDLIDVSPVNVPAYPATSAEANSLRLAEMRALFPEGLPEDIEQKNDIEQNDNEDAKQDERNWRAKAELALALSRSIR
jgi:uncharacterized protein